jgi:hypothetical protein
VRDWQPEWRGFLAGVATSLLRRAIAWVEPPSARIEVTNLPSSSPFRLQRVSRVKSQLRARERIVNFPAMASAVVGWAAPPHVPATGVSLGVSPRAVGCDLHGSD